MTDSVNCSPTSVDIGTKPANHSVSGASISPLSRRIATAPMMDCSDRHWRYLVRLFAPHILLYTEMVTTGAILHGDRSRFLDYAQQEHPVAVQLGGSSAKELAECAGIVEDLGYDEVNLNVGCPSERVRQGRFGACLMREPELVAECVAAMRARVAIPVTVKCRIGVDDQDTFEHLQHFVDRVRAAGCEVFIVHARKAWLSGLSPRQNRTIPPLRYPDVYRLKRVFPDLQIVINGGIDSIADIDMHLTQVDGVMIGRAAYANPAMLSAIDAEYHTGTRVTDLASVLDEYMDYMAGELRRGVYLKHMARHLLGIFSGCRGAKRWRRILSEQGARADAGLDVVRQARAVVDVTSSVVHQPSPHALSR